MLPIRHTLRVLLLPLALLQAPLPARAGAPGPALDKAISALPDSTAATGPADRLRAQPALWVVRDKDTTIYLFGTLHLMKPQVEWFRGAVRAAYGRSDEVITELGVTDEAAIGRLLAARAANRDGPPVLPALGQSHRERLLAALAAAGMPAAAADSLKPWFTAMLLTVAPLRQMGFDPRLGVDGLIQAQAKADGKPVSGLETPEEQFALFDRLPRDQQIALLVATLDEADNLSARVEAMLARWSAGDADGIAAILNEQTAVSPDLARALLTDRNARWADWIRARMKRPGTLFMAVGAGHLAGKDSVQAALAARGIASTRLPQD